MTIADVIRRLREDRVIAERERLQHRIAEAFELARRRNSLLSSRPNAERSMLQAGSVPRPCSLQEAALPLFRVAERKFAGPPVRHLHHQDVYVVVAPTTDINQLFEEALSALANVPQPTIEKRLEMEDL